MTLNEFLKKVKVEVDGYWGGMRNLFGSSDHLPCFANRFSVNDHMNTFALIDEYIKHASEFCDNDVLVFSVTERDKVWKVWADYAKAHPRKFKVVEGGSIHGKYMCRMYIYIKPAKERKFHPNNINQFIPR